MIGIYDIDGLLAIVPLKDWHVFVRGVVEYFMTLQCKAMLDQYCFQARNIAIRYFHSWTMYNNIDDKSETTECSIENCPYDLIC